MGAVLKVHGIFYWYSLLIIQLCQLFADNLPPPPPQLRHTLTFAQTSSATPVPTQLH